MQMHLLSVTSQDEWILCLLQ